ncbi:MAG: acetylglutamate kinase [Nitrospiraceae bacterium]|nr:acetylglutamate kinase [Nitrospiraceae bacterium]|tara:strand:- start:234 stop:1178 length:945 start_codon:yes stop_codon:yes gene_type:complete
MESLIKKADTLIEALPYIKEFSGKTIVIKYGGRAMVDPTLKEGFARDVVLMKFVGMHPIVVHGGGPQIDGMLKRVGLEPKFRHGIRVTDQATMDVVEMVLGGTINKEIASLISRHGGQGVGLSGKDGNLISARPLTKNEWVKRIGRGAGFFEGKEKEKQQRSKTQISESEYGMVGDVDRVDVQVLSRLQERESRSIPVIAPIASGIDGKVYNINADSVAGAIASALTAEKLLMLTDVQGIHGANGQRLAHLSRKDIGQLVKKDILKDGMLPKVHACLAALEGGVRKAHIIDGRVSHALLLEIFTDEGIGTEIVA